MSGVHLSTVMALQLSGFQTKLGGAILRLLCTSCILFMDALMTCAYQLEVPLAKLASAQPDGLKLPKLLRLGGKQQVVATELPLFHTCDTLSWWTGTLPGCEDTRNAKAHRQLRAEVAQCDSTVSETQTVLRCASLIVRRS